MSFTEQALEHWIFIILKKGRMRERGRNGEGKNKKKKKTVEITHFKNHKIHLLISFLFIL